MKKEITFDKYKKRGDYHWRGIGSNFFNSSAFLKARYEIVIKYLPKLSRSQKLIDIGCGDGALSYLIKTKKGGQIFGIDPSPEAIKIAQVKFKELGVKDCFFKTGSGYKLPFKDSNFDFAVMADVIEHVNYPEKILSEIQRILRKNGKLIVSSVIKQSKLPEDKMHAKEYSVTEMKKLLRKFFLVNEIRESHPVVIKKIYSLNLKTGEYRPQPFKYFINSLSLVGLNSFLWNIGVKYSCQTITCTNG